MPLPRASAPLDEPGSAPSPAKAPSKALRAALDYADRSLLCGWNPFSEPGAGSFFEPRDFPERFPAIHAILHKPEGWADWIDSRRGLIQSRIGAAKSEATHALALISLSSNPDALRLLEALLNAGADANARRSEFQPALFSASRPAAEILTRHGARLDSLNSEDEGPFHDWAYQAAIGNKTVDDLRWLIAQGAAPRLTERSEAGAAAIDRADSDELAVYLLSLGASPAYFCLSLQASIDETVESALLYPEAFEILSRAALAIGWPPLFAALERPFNENPLPMGDAVWSLGRFGLAQKLRALGWQSDQGFERIADRFIALRESVEVEAEVWRAVDGPSRALAWMIRRFSKASRAEALDLARRCDALGGPGRSHIAQALLSRGWIEPAGPASLAELFPAGWESDPLAPALKIGGSRHPVSTLSFGALVARAESALLRSCPAATPSSPKAKTL